MCVNAVHAESHLCVGFHRGRGAPRAATMGAMNPETPTQRLDRLVHAAAAQMFTHGLSPVSLSLAWADWRT